MGFEAKLGRFEKNENKFTFFRIKNLIIPKKSVCFLCFLPISFKEIPDVRTIKYYIGY